MIAKYFDNLNDSIKIITKYFDNLNNIIIQNFLKINRLFIKKFVNILFNSKRLNK